MRRSSAIFMLMFVFAFSASAASISNQFDMTASCQLLAQDKGDNNKEASKQEEPEPDC